MKQIRFGICICNLPVTTQNFVKNILDHIFITILQMAHLKTKIHIWLLIKTLFKHIRQYLGSTHLPIFGQMSKQGSSLNSTNLFNSKNSRSLFSILILWHNRRTFKLNKFILINKQLKIKRIIIIMMVQILVEEDTLMASCYIIATLTNWEMVMVQCGEIMMIIAMMLVEMIIGTISKMDKTNMI